MTDNTDRLAAARARLAELREIEAKAVPGPWRRGQYAMDGAEITSEALDEDGHPSLHIYDEGGHIAEDADAIVALRNAAPALLDLAEAAARLRPRWWRELDQMDEPYCVACDGQLRQIDVGPDDADPYGDGWEWRIDHADDCPALALDAALARLGEVTP